MKTIKILFVEDHEMFRKAIISSLENQSLFKTDIIEAKDGAEAIDLATKNEVDIYLVDISLPKIDGIALTQLLFQKLDDPKVLALTMHNEDYMIRQMLEVGVLGYVLKNSSIEELSRAILTVADGKKYYSNEVAQIIINGNDHYTEKAKTNALKESLSERELEVLKLIVAEKSNKEISEILNISDRTVGNHRNNLIEKLKVKKSIGLAVFAVKNGLA